MGVYWVGLGVSSLSRLLRAGSFGDICCKGAYTIGVGSRVVVVVVLVGGRGGGGGLLAGGVGRAACTRMNGAAYLGTSPITGSKVLGFQDGAKFGYQGRSVRPSWVLEARKTLVKGFCEHGDRVETSCELGFHGFSAIGNGAPDIINSIPGWWCRRALN